MNKYEAEHKIEDLIAIYEDHSRDGLTLKSAELIARDTLGMSKETFYRLHKEAKDKGLIVHKQPHDGTYVARKEPAIPRAINSHKVNPANDTLEITVRDEPGAGGASHCYHVSGMDLESNPSMADNLLQAWELQAGIPIVFQNGPINEAGVNGITQEALIAICIDRLESFQAGPYACRENAIALTKLQEAQMWLQKRTRDRMARGVEGTHEK